MNKRFQTNQHILLSGLAFRFAIAFLLCSPAIAQLAPNPNPPGNTIIINTPGAQTVVDFDNLGTINILSTGDLFNFGPGSAIFNNLGTIDNDGYLTNKRTINNYSYIDNSGSLQNFGNFFNLSMGTIDNSGEIINEASFDNSGTINSLSTGTIWNVGGIDNSGTINNSGTIQNYETIDNLSMGTIENDGTWHNSGGTFNNQGTIDNSGTIYNDYLIDNSGTIYNSGTINNQSMGNISGYLGTINNLSMGTIENDGTIENFGGTFNNQGILKGTGTFIGDLLNDIGTVAPGNSAGTMTVDGDFTLDDFGILDIEIGGFTPGTFDILDITGTAYMPGGNVNFSFLDGYDIVADIGPLQSKELSFLYAGSIDSIFNPLFNYNFTSLPYFQFNVFQHETELVFEATNLVPLPSAVLLGGIGLAFASWKLRRRKEL